MSEELDLQAIYDQQQQELIEDRKKLLAEIHKIGDIEISKEYDEIDMKRYQYYYLGWSLASIIVILVAIKIAK